VFVHHACVWYFHLRTGRWEVPPSALHTQLGQASVVLFFMITGFPFCTKLIDAKTRRIDWLGVYVSRVLRLAPLYMVCMSGLFVIVVALSRGTLNQPIGALSADVSRWLSFTMLGEPDLNKVERTSLIVAGVTWTLRYVRGRHRRGLRASPARAGELGATADRVGHRRRVLGERGDGVRHRVRTGPDRLAGRRLLLDRMRHRPVRRPRSGDLPHARRNDVRDLPAAWDRAVRRVPLPAGPFHFLLGRESSAELSAFEHWSVVLALVPALIALCCAALVIVERPGMRAVPRVTSLVRRKWSAVAGSGAGSRTR
jgi:hypothetical protein